MKKDDVKKMEGEESQRLHSAADGAEKKDPAEGKMNKAEEGVKKGGEEEGVKKVIK